MLGLDNPSTRLDVADVLEDKDNQPFRKRFTAPAHEQPDADGMRLVTAIPLRPAEADEGDDETESEDGGSVTQARYFFVRPPAADDDGSKTANREQELPEHLERAEKAAKALARRAGLDDRHVRLVSLAAKWHDLGKARAVWQKSIGNMGYAAGKVLAKSGRAGPLRELSNYRHEFGSLLEVAGKLEFKALAAEDQDLVIHLIAAHHGRARPFYPADEAYDPERPAEDAAALAERIPEVFARLQRRYGRWGLAYLESLVRAADYLASEPEKKERK
jgi:CRISPR-associated endonuclease/helicase Cas3